MPSGITFRFSKLPNPVAARRHGRVTGLALAIAVAALVVVAPAATGARSAATDTLNIAIIQDWTTMDPLQDDRPVPQQIESFGYDSLGAPSSTNPNSSIPVPYVATSWTVAKKSVTFNIRKGVTCQDGTPVTPGVIAQSFQKFVSLPKTNAQVSTLFGPPPYKITASNKKGTFTFATEVPFRLLLLNVAETPIVCPSGLAAFAADPTALQAAMYGSGPYELVSSQHGNDIVFKKNPNWNWPPQGGVPGSQLPENVILHVETDPTTTANLLDTGGLDIANVDGPDVPRLTTDSSLIYDKVKGLRSFSITFNLRPETPFGDIVLRRAVQAAADPKAFMQAAYAGLGDITYLPGQADTNECYDPSLTAKYYKAPSMTRALQILQQGGYTLSGGKLMKNGQQVSARVLTSQDVGSAPDLLQALLNQLGIATQMNEVGGSAYGTNFLNANFDIALQRGQDFPWNGRPPAYVGPAPPNGSNYIGYNDVHLQHIANHASYTPGKAACPFYQEAGIIQYQNAYNVPVGDPWTNMFARKATVKSFFSLGNSSVPIYYVHLAG